MDARALDRADGDAREWQGLAFGEWAVVGAATVLLLSLPALDWFAFSDREQIVIGSPGNAFRWLDGLDYVLLALGLVAVAAPLVRSMGLVSARPRDVAFATGSAGLITAVVITGLIVSPPDLERGFLSVPVGGGPTAETIVRGGAVVGLLAALGIVALSVLTIVASPAALAPVHRTPLPVRPDDARPREAAKVPAGAPVGAAKPKPKPRPKPKPKPAARKRTTRPKAPARPRRAPKPPARPSLATATADDLVGVGFTPTQAERIVEYRDDLGKVSKRSDLRRVPGIAKPVLAELVKRLDE